MRWDGGGREEQREHREDGEHGEQRDRSRERQGELLVVERTVVGDCRASQEAYRCFNAAA